MTSVQTSPEATESVTQRLLKTLSTSSWWIGLLLFVVALVWRALLIDDVVFAGDQSGYFVTGIGMVEGRGIPSFGAGLSTGGRLPGSLYHLLCAFPLLFSKTPEASAFLVAVFGAISSVCLWDALRRPFGAWAAVGAGILYALLPWPVLNSIHIWNPNYALSFVTIAFWAAHRVRQNPRSRLIGVFALVLVSLPEFHMTAVLMAPPLCLILLPAIRGIRYRWALLGLLIGLLPYIGTVISELDTDFENARTILDRGARAAEEPRGTFLEAPLYAFRFMTLETSYFALSWGGLSHEQMMEFVFEGNDRLPASTLKLGTLALSVLLALAALFALLYGALKRGSLGAYHRSLLISVFISTALVAAALAYANQQIFGHYVLVVLPFWFAAFACLGRYLHSPSAKAVFAVVVILIAGAGIEQTGTLLTQVDGPRSLRVRRLVIEAVLEDLKSEAPDGFAAVSYSFYENRATYAALFRHVYGEKDRFQRPASLRYRLQRPGESPPRGGAVERFHAPGAVLYRLDP